MLAAREWIGLDADQTEEPGDVALDLVADDLGVARVARRLERPDDVHRHTRLTPGRVDREVGGRPQVRDVLRGVPPSEHPLGPEFGLGLGVLVGRLAGGVGLGLVDPWPELGGGQTREGQAEVREVSLGVDQQGRQTAREDLFDEDHPEAGLARSGHADDHAVGGEGVGVEAHLVAGAVVCGRVDVTAEKQFTHARRG